MSNVAEHGDAQSGILTGQTPREEDRMDDDGREVAAGNVASCENVNTVELRRTLERMVEGLEREYTLHAFLHGEMCVFIVRMADVQHQTNDVSLVGSLGSSVLPIDPRGVPESRSPANWIRSQIQEHLAVTPQMLVVLIPLELIKFLIDLALSQRGKRKIRQQYWKSIQAKRKNMGKKLRRELQECMSGAEVVVGEEFDWDYKQQYICDIQTAVVELAHTGLSPLEICALVRKGQQRPEARPKHSPGCLGAGVRATMFALEQCNMTLEANMKVIDQFRETFALIWSTVEDEYEDEDED
jgi:BMFP domain-containing protein YqiC